MKSIGKYQVIEELGSSATGTTFRVRDAFRHRELGVKLLKTVPSLTTEAKEHFCDCLARCAELTHRQIAKVLDLGEVEEGIFVASEWRSGSDLRHFMDQNGDLPLDQKLAVVAQVAEGLAFAHSRGIAHGNLKPSNIFVDAARDASILDFGIAQWLQALIEAGCRPEGLVPNYLAPEQILGQSFDARSDIFALGLMLYEFASGKYPFSNDAGLIPRDIVHSQPEPMRSWNAQVPDDLERLVQRALQKKPEDRLQTAEEFASGLYFAAQHLRRAASSGALEQPPPPEPSREAIVEPPSSAEPAAAIEPEPSAEPATEPAAEQNAFALPENTLQIPIPPPSRERPQDAQSAPKPWTARSYASTRIDKPSAERPPAQAPSEPARPAPAPRVAAAAQQPSAASAPPFEPERSDPPTFIPPQSFLPPPIPIVEPVARHPKRGNWSRRLLITAAGLILAVILAATFISRQNLKASQRRNRAATAVDNPVAPAPPKATAPHPAAPAPQIDAAHSKVPEPVETRTPEIPAQQILAGRVRPLWESGKYAQALFLVNQILANDPTNPEALAWKKKIREAQAAEAALK
jgi:eukaryotic-like serine/threonine-protein kinase